MQRLLRGVRLLRRRCDGFRFRCRIFYHRRFRTVRESLNRFENRFIWQFFQKLWKVVRDIVEFIRSFQKTASYEQDGKRTAAIRHMKRLLDFRKKTVVVFIFDIDENQKRIIRLCVFLLPVLLELCAVVTGGRSEQQYPWARHEACAQKDQIDGYPDMSWHTTACKTEY